MCKLRWVILIAVAFICINVIAESQISEIEEDNYNANATKVLSRRKRFIVFPDGSSFQLGKYFNVFLLDFAQLYY